MTLVTESRPRKHSRKLDGKRVIIKNKNSPRITRSGTYKYTGDICSFCLDDGVHAYHHEKGCWTVEEIIERVE
jgi:hypothetical protein